MLFDTFPPGTEKKSNLREVLARRVAYLADRAAFIADRSTNDPSISWRSELAQATLWIEASEGAVALGEYGRALEHLYRAVQLLLRLRLPFGAALQLAFFANDRDLNFDSRETIDSWSRALIKPQTDSDATPVDEAARSEPFTLAARRKPQQWAYFAMATAGLSEGLLEETLTRKLIELASTPVGRLRFPLDYYALIASVRRTAGRSSAISSLSARYVAEIIGKSLTGLHRSLDWAAANTYLWNRMLSPVPLFDLDSAVIIALARQAETRLKRQPLIVLTQPYVAEDSQLYAQEFVRAADALRQGKDHQARDA